jgi:hypothetical protein
LAAPQSPIVHAASQQFTASAGDRAPPDAHRFCRKLLDQGDFAMLACLTENRPKLSAACRNVLVSHGQ